MIAIDTALFLAEYLQRSGVRRVYVVPDRDVATVLNALRLRGLEVIPTNQPTSGALLAAAESAVHGGTGVIVSGAGPSAAEIASAAVEAQLNRRSLIAITVEPNGPQGSRALRRTFDLRAIFASVSKGSYRLTADNARELVPLASRLATAPPRGVVHLRVQAEEWSKSAPAARGQAHPPAPPPSEEHSALVQRAAELIAGARRLTLVVGPETLEAEALAAARLLAEQWDAPAVATPMAKGAMPETHPLFAGVYGALGDRPIVELIEQSDVVVGFGVTSLDFTHPWRSAAPAIHLTHSASADPGFPSEVVLSGPLNALANEIARQPTEGFGGQAVAARTRRLVHDAIAQGAARAAHPTPQRGLAELRRLAPPGLIVSAETDVAGLLAAQVWTAVEPRQFLISNGLGLPGAGLALAAVAARHRAGQPVAWIGTDLALAARADLLAQLRDVASSVALIAVNQGLRPELLAAQEAAGYPRVASEYQPPDFEALASAYGLAYTRVRSADEVESALAQALTSERATLLDLLGDRDDWWRVA